MLKTSHLLQPIALKHFFPSLFPSVLFFSPKPLNNLDCNELAIGRKPHPFKVKILMLLRHFIAHLGSLGSTYHHCPARQAKKSTRKKNKCDDSWALANESWSETSQKRISVLHRLTYGVELETRKVQRSHHRGKGLQHELASLI